MFSPKFTITPKILENASRIEAARSLIENSPLIPTYERQFKNEAMVRTVHHSTHIEGNPLPFTQVKRVLDGREEEVVAKPRDVQEILNYRRVVGFIDKAAREGWVKKIDEDLILKIHRLVVEKISPPEEAGNYRTGLVTIRNSHTGEISYAPPRPEYVSSQVQEFLRWLGSDAAVKLHPVLRAGIILAEVARIHPFFAGNGRTARSLATLSLYLDGYDIKRFFCLDEYYDKDAPAYFAAIQTYKRASDDLTGWLEYFTEGLAIELNYVKERVLKLSKETQIRQKVGHIFLSERQEKIVSYLADYGRLTNADFHKIFPDISDDTILREITGLLKKGIVVKRGKTKSAYYQLK